ARVRRPRRRHHYQDRDAGRPAHRRVGARAGDPGGVDAHAQRRAVARGAGGGRLRLGPRGGQQRHRGPPTQPAAQARQRGHPQRARRGLPRGGAFALRSIRRHLLAWVLGTLSLGSVALALVLYSVTLEEMSEVFDEQLKQVALTVLTQFNGQGSPAAAPAPARGDVQDFAFVTQVWALDGQRLFASAPDAGIPFEPREGFTTVRTHDGRWRV